MNRKSKYIQLVSSAPVLAALSLFFVLGVFLGQAVANDTDGRVSQELERYVSEFLLLDETDTGTSQAVFSTLILYFRYPVLALLVGFTAIGVVLLPGLTTAFGFFLSFAACCFTAAFGKEGTLLAFAVFGLRCVISIPCYFLVAVPAWKSAASLTGFYFRRGYRTTRPCLMPTPWRSIMIVALVLFLGVCLDLYLAPWFLQIILNRIFL